MAARIAHLALGLAALTRGRYPDHDVAFLVGFIFRARISGLFTTSGQTTARSRRWRQRYLILQGNVTLG